MDHLAIRLSDGVTIAVPPSFNSISTFVLLEQECWFEKECAFVRRWLRPGMTAIDIGANVGVYSLPMARQVAPDGRVIAYEPGSAPRQLLEISKTLNQADNLEIVAAALSDGKRQGHLVFGASSELSSLGADGPGEDVLVTSLDLEDAARAWPSPDFVKIDAEGEEVRILAGGRAFFDRHSPLVLFEIKAASGTNTRLLSAFMDIGYECYRVLAGEPILLRSDQQSPLDDFELNLFAAKPDRARSLAAEGLLVDPLPSWTPSESARGSGIAHLKRQAFTAPVAKHMNFGAAHDPDYLDALAAYAQWHDVTQGATDRCAALAFAYASLEALCRRAPSVARLSTFARCAWDWGRRTECVAALFKLIEMSNQGAAPAEPFWPACARFDKIVPQFAPPQTWFLSAAVEQLVRAAHYSEIFCTEPSPYLAWLCAQPFASVEIERRRFLEAALARQRIDMPARLRTEAPDHLNAALWRQMKINSPPS